MADKEKLEEIKGYSIHFLPYSEIRDLNSDMRIKKIIEIILDNNILLIQGKLKPEEEVRLIRNTMAIAGKDKNFKGIELASISEEAEKGFFGKIKSVLANALSGGDFRAITIVGPATIVKEIKRDPKKIELMLNKV